MDNVGDVRGLGLMCGVELVEDKPTKARFPAARKVGARLYQECAKRGLVSRIKDDIYMLAPAFVISDDDIDRLVNCKFVIGLDKKIIEQEESHKRGCYIWSKSQIGCDNSQRY